MKDQIEAKLEEYLPLIREKIGTISANITHGELEDRVLKAHKFLPMAARIIIRKKWLVSFCIKNKNKLSTLNDNADKSVTVEDDGTKAEDESFEL